MADKLSFPVDWYNPITLRRIPDDDLRAEYRRLREIANKRLDRLGKSEFMTEAQAKNRKNDFAPAKSLDKNELVYSLSDVAGFVNSKLSTVTGQKAKRDKFLETMEERGYTFIKKQDYKTFGDYMDRIRPYINAQIVGSDDIVELAQTETDERKKDFRQIIPALNQYIKNVEEIKRALPRYRNQKLTERDVERILKNRRNKKQLSRAAREAKKEARKQKNKKRR